YLTGADPSAWRTDVPTYSNVTYTGVWPGVDVVFLGDQRRLRHDFVVAPGADPSAIAVTFEGQAAPTIDPATGDLLVGGARLSRPTVFQNADDGARRPVDGAFRLLGGGGGGGGGDHVGFDIGAYDRTRPLVIDPTLVTSSYLGGAGIDNAAAVDVDGGGNVYIVGSTESADFRATNPFQNTLNGDGSAGKSDAFVAKLSADGASLLYATYLGGNNRDAAAGVAVGGDGSLYVTGVTESDNFPKTDGVAQGNYGGGPSDAFVTKLNSAGSGLAWSTFVGGAQTDAARSVALNPTGEAYVTGSTNSVEFPTANPLQQAAPQPDDVDAFVTKISSDGTSFVYSTRHGGSNDDRGLDIAVDATGNAYVTGDTRSPGFPTARPLQPGAGGSASGVAGSFSDAFVSKFGPAGNNLVYSTFLGGSDTDQGGAITVDAEGSAYVTGTTNSPNFPVKAALQERKDSDTDAFVTQVNPAGSELVYSTYLGGGGADSGTGIMVDQFGSVTVVGVTGSSNFPTAKPLQGVKGGGATDGFVSTLASGGGTLVSSSYLGGREDDQAVGVAVGPGAATPVIVGSTSSADFPTAKPLQSARAGSSADAFVTRVSAADDATPVTTAGTGGAVTTPAPAKSGTHDQRVRLLVATTAGLFLIAVLQTAYLRRKAAAESAQWGGHDQPAPLVPPPPAQTWAGGVRVIDDEAGDADADRTRLSTTAGSGMAAPDLLEEDWVPAPPRPTPLPPLRPAPRVPLEELSFWDLFPEDLPPSRRPGALDDTDWALEDQEDVLVRPGNQPPPPSAPPPPPPVPNPWADDALAGPAAAPE
ncbi:MAG TPA: SBBP repeat-containing protein, partial [Acidimicrobiales bacterium]